MADHSPAKAVEERARVAATRVVMSERRVSMGHLLWMGRGRGAGIAGGYRTLRGDGLDAGGDVFVVGGAGQPIAIFRGGQLVRGDAGDGVLSGAVGVGEALAVGERGVARLEGVGDLHDGDRGAAAGGDS